MLIWVPIPNFMWDLILSGLDGYIRHQMAGQAKVYTGACSHGKCDHVTWTWQTERVSSMVSCFSSWSTYVKWISLIIKLVRDIGRYEPIFQVRLLHRNQNQSSANQGSDDLFMLYGFRSLSNSSKILAIWTHISSLVEIYTDLFELSNC